MSETEDSSSSKQSSDHGFLRFEEEEEEEPGSHEQLLPGILDDITVRHIAAKLEWRTLCILSSVSRAWKKEFRSRRDARVRLLVTEEVYVAHIEGRAVNSVCLSPTRPGDGFVYELPPIPNVDKGFPTDCLSVVLDGKVYVEGREQDEVYVMDLAADVRQWEQWKGREYARRFVRSEYIGGQRIDLFEVYDPESNTWKLMELLPGSSWTAPGLNILRIPNTQVIAQMSKLPQLPFRSATFDVSDFQCFLQCLPKGGEVGSPEREGQREFESRKMAAVLRFWD